jgi:hypothetical protein
MEILRVVLLIKISEALEFDPADFLKTLSTVRDDWCPVSEVRVLA